MWMSLTEKVISNIWRLRMSVGVTIAGTTTCTSFILRISICKCPNAVDMMGQDLVHQ